MPVRGSCSGRPIEAPAMRPYSGAALISTSGRFFSSTSSSTARVRARLAAATRRSALAAKAFCHQLVEHRVLVQAPPVGGQRLGFERLARPRP
jgi:hypothetical protein